VVAAHVGDLEKGIRSAVRRDMEVSRARRAMDWDAQREAALFPWKFDRVTGMSSQGCAMCGPLCAMRIAQEALGSWKKV